MTSAELRMPMPWGHIAAKTWGCPKDERVLVVHGILDNAGSFDRLIALLPNGYYFVCIDLPGHGLSSHYPAGIPLDFLNYVMAIRRVLDYLKWEKCIYLGHSLGANLGTMFTAIYPERIIKIFCLDAFFSKSVLNHELIPQIRRVQDKTLKIKGEGAIATKLYTEEEIMYILMNLRTNTLNVAAAKALMKRSVTKVGDKYKFNRDPRLNVGLLPLLNLEQHLTIFGQLKLPISIIIASATLAMNQNKGMNKIFYKMSLDKKYSVVLVEGNHDVHNNNPEKVAPHVSKFLGGVKSRL